MSMQHPLVQKVEQRFIRPDPLPEMRPGDTVKVWVRIREGEKQRLQAFEGVCISTQRGGNRSSFTVRKVSYGVGVERVFPVSSPNIDRVEITARGKVRQARLYYLRNLRGKAARIKERAFDRTKAEQTGSDKKRKKRGRHRKAAAKATAK